MRALKISYTLLLLSACAFAQVPSYLPGFPVTASKVRIAPVGGPGYLQSAYVVKPHSAAAAGGGCPTCNTGLLAYLPFEGDLSDKTALQTWAAYSTGTFAYTTGKIGQGDNAEKTGPSNLGAQSSSNIDLTLTGAWTVAVWVQVSIAPPSGNRPIWIFTGSASGGYVKNTAANAGTYQFFLGAFVNSTVAYVAGAWTYVIVSCSANTIRFFIDNTTGITAASPSGQCSTYIDLIGYNNANQWPGIIDEFGVWNRVLTAEERTALYNGGNGLAYTAW
ncbi:MAG: LamG domain-containing protein [Minisyncoccia bacterium]